MIALLVMMILNNIIECPIIGFIIFFIEERQTKIETSNHSEYEKRLSNNSDLDNYLKICLTHRNREEDKKKRKRSSVIQQPQQELTEKFPKPTFMATPSKSMPNFELFNYPKVNDRYRVSSPDKNYSIERAMGASKKRTGGASPFKEAPYSDIIKNNVDDYNFRKKETNDPKKEIDINIDLRVEDDKKNKK